ncbi:MAG: hypothetical protein KDB22_26095 [Planctomycetales bacterium]|nr:hypothetical protein [Planctomycetales bacterium]
MNVLVLVRDEHRYVFIYVDKYCTETLRMLGRFAADPGMNFSWLDAAVLSKKLRDETSNRGRYER